MYIIGKYYKNLWTMKGLTRIHLKVTFIKARETAMSL